jgi:hypothetical protein
MRAGRFRFYLGTHQPHWLWHAEVPLMVSARQPVLPQASCRWALDSGAFTELSVHGRWTLPTACYAEQAARLADQLGGLDFAAPQDWMCEPAILARTGLSVAEHQQRTVANYLELRTLAPWLPWIPVVQGWRLDDYLACVALYQRAGAFTWPPAWSMWSAPATRPAAGTAAASTAPIAPPGSGRSPLPPRSPRRSRAACPRLGPRRRGLHRPRWRGRRGARHPHPAVP